MNKIEIKPLSDKEIERKVCRKMYMTVTYDGKPLYGGLFND